jgi:hypothetical protein
MDMGARFLLNVGFLTALLGAIVAMTALAWVRGSAAVRYGATIYAVTAIVFMLVRLVSGEELPPAVELLVDALVGVSYLWLALRFNNPWLGAAMILKGAQLALHAAHLTALGDERAFGLNLYAASLNLIAVAVVAVFFWAIFTTPRASRGLQHLHDSTDVVTG